MPLVVDYEEFKILADRVDRLNDEVEFWKSLMTGQKYMTRGQAMQALGCSSATLSRLTNDGRLEYEKQGRSIRYLIDSVRSYLTGKKIDLFSADRRILKAVHSVRSAA